MADFRVAGVAYYELDGQLLEIKRQIRQPNGYPFDLLQLKAHLQAAIEGRFGLVAGNLKRDRRNDGWMLLENQPRRIGGPIVGVPLLNNDELSMNGEMMAQRAITLDANYGQEDAEWLLEHQEDMIPAELRNYYLVFPATKWQHAGGDRGVSYLRWRGGRWVLGFCWLGYVFNGDFRLVRPRK